jgi:hypothetical protein
VKLSFQVILKFFLVGHNITYMCEHRHHRILYHLSLIQVYPIHHKMCNFILKTGLPNCFSEIKYSWKSLVIDKEMLHMQKYKSGRLCQVTATSFYVNTSLRVERNKFGVIIKHIYCSLLFNINLFRTGWWYEKYDTYGKVCTETFLVNVRSMHVLHRVVAANFCSPNWTWIS